MSARPSPRQPLAMAYIPVLRPALVGASTKTWSRSLSDERTPGDWLDHRLRRDVKMLGGILGRAIEKHSGESGFRVRDKFRMASGHRAGGGAPR